MFSILIHIYYRDSWEKFFKERLKNLENYSPVIMVNLCMITPWNPQIISSIKNDFPKAMIIKTPNKGKDIGGKLALIDLFIKTSQQSDLIVFLHDKTTPYLINGETWRNRLFGIIDPEKINTIINEFQNNKQIGIIGAKDFIRNEFDKKKNKLETTNSNKLKELVERYNINVTDYSFIAGSMFWIRTLIIQKFFSRYLALNCREMLEDGDFTDRYEGTYTHSWERIFCWIANDQHFVIKGI